MIVLRIEIEGAKPNLLRLSKRDTVFGRSDSTNVIIPDFDLTAFGAYKNGVSRIHAAIRRGEDTLTLVDLGSVNGTHLNGQRLIPNQPCVLRNGDEIRLGKMKMKVYFRQPPGGDGEGGGEIPPIGGGSKGSGEIPPIEPALDPIFPPRPPKTLTAKARAKPEDDDDDLP